MDSWINHHVSYWNTSSCTCVLWCWLSSAPNWGWVSLQTSGSVRRNRQGGQVSSFCRGHAGVCIQPPGRCWQTAEAQYSTKTKENTDREEKSQYEGCQTTCRKKDVDSLATRRGQTLSVNSLVDVRLWNQETKNNKITTELEKHRGSCEADTRNQQQAALDGQKLKRKQEEMSNCEQMEICNVIFHWAAHGLTQIRH